MISTVDEDLHKGALNFENPEDPESGAAPHRAPAPNADAGAADVLTTVTA